MKQKRRWIALALVVLALGVVVIERKRATREAGTSGSTRRDAEYYLRGARFYSGEGDAVRAHTFAQRALTLDRELEEAQHLFVRALLHLGASDAEIRLQVKTLGLPLLDGSGAHLDEVDRLLDLADLEMSQEQWFTALRHVERVRIHLIRRSFEAGRIAGRTTHAEDLFRNAKALTDRARQNHDRLDRILTGSQVPAPEDWRKSDPRIARLLAGARDRLRAGELASVELICQAILELDPGHPAALGLRDRARKIPGKIRSALARSPRHTPGARAEFESIRALYLDGGQTGFGGFDLRARSLRDIGLFLSEISGSAVHLDAGVDPDARVHLRVDSLKPEDVLAALEKASEFTHTRDGEALVIVRKGP